MKKFRKNLCLFLALIMCLGMVNISALAATFDDLQNAIDGVVAETEPAAPETPAEPSAGGDAGSSEDAGTPPVDPAPQSTANGTRFDHTNEDGTTSDRYGYGWNEGNNWWGIEAWDDENGRNVQLNEDVEEPEHTDPDSVPTDPAVTIDAGDKVTIDLNGNDIDGSGRGGETIVVENGGNLTLTGNAEDEGKVIGSDGHNVVTVTGKDSELTLEDGVNITHDAGNKLENMPEANPVVPADPDPADPADPAPAADGDEEADTPETPEAKKPTFSTGKTDENGKTTTTTGRGVEVDGGKLTMNGGKITDNNVGGEVGETSDKNSSGNENGNFEGKVGGGVFVHDGGTFEMNDGEISNNAAAEGGGVFVGTDTKDANTDHSSIKMTGGKVDGNVAKSGEGGGIYIRSTGQNSEDGNIITGGDITGNATFTTKDLGGGGIYVESNGGELTIKNAVIRNNTAEGLGGGISACVHGETVIAVVDGAIIYGNHANGETHSTGYKGTDNAWTDGTIAIATDKGIGGSWVTDKDGNKHWQWNTDFANAAQDIFTASSGKDVNSQGTPGIIICSEMLNGIQPGWSGIGYELCNQGDEGAIKFKNTSGHWFYCRPVTITAEKDDDGNIKQLVVTSERAIGLTAGEISDADKALIEKFVNQPSRVLIEGNYSAVHGGAIGNNGRLNIGTYSNDTIKGVDTVITIDTNKKVTVKNPESVGEDMRVDTDDDFKMEGGEFTFELVQDPNDSDTKVLWTAQNTADGKVDIRIPSDLLQNAGTHTFYLREQTGDVNGITYDGAVYKIVVTVAVDENDPDNTNLTIGKDTITVQKLTATKTVTKGKLDADGNWVEDTDESGNSNASAEFNNTYTKKTEECVDISVRKTWDDNNDPNRPASVTIRLIRNDVLFETITLNGTNNWNHQWKGLDLLDEQGHKINWTVEEVGVDGYTASYGTVDHNTQRGFDVTVTNSKNPEEPGPEPTPTPDPEPTPTPDPEPDIPDPDVPTTEPDPEPEEPVDIPDEETPTTDIPDEETPTTDLPDEEPPLTELPEEPVPLVPAEPELELPEDPVPLVPAEPEVELPEDPVPLANVPQTGDISLVWYAVAAMSAMGLAVLTLKKREDEEN